MHKRHKPMELVPSSQRSAHCSVQAAAWWPPVPHPVPRKHESTAMDIVAAPQEIHLGGVLRAKAAPVGVPICHSSAPIPNNQS
jgi:hypothetical protein